MANYESKLAYRIIGKIVVTVIVLAALWCAGIFLAAVLKQTDFVTEWQAMIDFFERYGHGAAQIQNLQEII
jgi:hypothetical protein